MHFATVNIVQPRPPVDWTTALTITCSLLHCFHVALPSPCHHLLISSLLPSPSSQASPLPSWPSLPSRHSRPSWPSSLPSWLVQLLLLVPATVRCTTRRRWLRRPSAILALAKASHCAGGCISELRTHIKATSGSDQNDESTVKKKSSKPLAVLTFGHVEMTNRQSNDADM